MSPFARCKLTQDAPFRSALRLPGFGPLFSSRQSVIRPQSRPRESRPGGAVCERLRRRLAGRAVSLDGSRRVTALPDLAARQGRASYPTVTLPSVGVGVTAATIVPAMVNTTRDTTIPTSAVTTMKPTVLSGADFISTGRPRYSK